MALCAYVATTQWSQVLAARNGTDTEAREALEALCQTYWQPLYAYIRHQGHGPEQARDLTQAYFAELLEKNLLAEVDPAKGRFRAYLLATLRHFLSHERDRERALKRGGGTTTLSLDVEDGEARYVNQPTESMTPIDVFEHRWAMTVLDRAMQRLAAEFKDGGNGEQFETLRQYLTSANPQVPYGDAAEQLGMSEGAIRTAVHRLRKRYGQALRAEIAQTVANPADTDEEVRHLLAVVRT
jgi:RNA polymerase sigma-70 factor (ECF subfamily)